MKHVVNHDIGQERAKAAAEAAFDAYAKKFEKYSPKVNWTSPNTAKISFQVKGFQLNGSLDVLPKTIEMDLDVPFLLRPFKGQALSVIEGEINKWISKARDGKV